MKLLIYTERIWDLHFKYINFLFKIIDDLLDFTETADQIGKPANADLKLGLVTAPVLYAAEQNPELWKLISRKFSNEGDVALVTFIYQRHYH